MHGTSYGDGRGLGSVLTTHGCTHQALPHCRFKMTVVNVGLAVPHCQHLRRIVAVKHLQQRVEPLYMVRRLDGNVVEKSTATGKHTK